MRRDCLCLAVALCARLLAAAAALVPSGETICIDEGAVEKAENVPAADWCLRSGETVAVLSGRTGALQSLKGADGRGARRSGPRGVLAVAPVGGWRGDGPEVLRLRFRAQGEPPSLLAAGGADRGDRRADGGWRDPLPSARLRLAEGPAPQLDRRAARGRGGIGCALLADAGRMRGDGLSHARSWAWYEPICWPKRRKGSGGLYPGYAQMQFLAHYRDGKGLYFAAHDETHVQKGVEWEWMEAGRIRLSLQTFCGEAKAGIYESAFDYRLRPYAGGWLEACSLHRDWVRTLPGFAKKAERPKWLRETRVVEGGLPLTRQGKPKEGF